MEKKIKVLHAITRLDKGGSSDNTLLCSIGLVGKGYSVDILYGKTEDSDGNLIERAKGCGVNFIKEETLVRNIHLFSDISALFRIFHILNKNKYDIVHAHSHKAGFIARIAAKLAGVKHIVYTPHGHVFYGYFSKTLTSVIILAEKITASITDKIIGLTPSECKEWLDLGIGREDKYTSIPSGIDFAELEGVKVNSIDWRAKLGITSDKTIIGSVGRFIEIKGFIFLIEAAIDQMKKRKDIYFILAGDGPLYDKYLDMLSSEGLDGRFYIVPWQKDVGSIIKAMDIFVLSSLNEGMGRVLIEAMFLGKPAIATCVGGVPSIISDGAGILVDPASSHDISGAIDSILDDREKAANMGRRGHDKVAEGYSVEVMVDKLDELYMELIGSS